MTLYKEVSNNTFAIWNGEPIDGIRYPKNIESLWSNTNLAALDLYIPVDPGVADGRIVNTTSVARISNNVQYSYTYRDLSEEIPANFPLTSRQLRLGLIRNGYTLSFIQNIIDAIPDSTERDEAQVWWEFSDQIEWEHPMTGALLTLSGISANDAVTMWMTAKDYDA